MPDTATTLPTLLTSIEVADILRISDNRLRAMRMRGEGPSFLKLPSGAVRYTVEAVEKWIGGGSE